MHLQYLLSPALPPELRSVFFGAAEDNLFIGMSKDRGIDCMYKYEAGNFTKKTLFKVYLPYAEPESQ
jgi:hypothetical protein